MAIQVSTHARASRGIDPLFNPGDPAMRPDPYPAYKRLRESDPVHWSPLGFWVVSRYCDVASIHQDPRFDRGVGPGDGRIANWGGADSPVAVELARWMLHQNPPDHTRLRGLVQPSFRQATFRSLRPRIERRVRELIDPLLNQGSMDVVVDLAYRLPVSVISDLLGLPVGDHEQCRRWADAIAQAFHPVQTPETLSAAARAIEDASEYIRRLVAARRQDPAPDLLSSLIEAEEVGERLSEPELVSTVNLLFFAGYETTTNLIGNGLLALLRHPAELRRLRSEPALIPNAVQELLRYDSPVQANRRVAREDVELEGATIRAGQHVMLLIGAAHRDPEVFSEPDRLDVGRPDVRPLSFGGGVHFCLGAGLARIEAEVALASLLQLNNLELATTEPRWRDNFILRGLEALPVSFEPHASPD